MVGILQHSGMAEEVLCRRRGGLIQVQMHADPLEISLETYGHYFEAFIMSDLKH